MKKHENHRFPEALSREPDADELEAVWNALEAADTAAPVSVERTDAAWSRLSSALKLDGAVGGGSPRGDVDPSDAIHTRRVTGRAPWLRAAAAIAMLAGGLTVWAQIPVTHEAPVGERVSVTLPDGSSVELNAGSTLSHRRGFDLLPGMSHARRTVRLDGEAFFDVATAERPFEVVAGTARVTVLGTRFNVRARGDAAVPASVRVDVEEGRVRVRAEDTSAEAELGAGESVRVEAGVAALTPSPVPAGRIAPWRNGGLTVSDEPLSAVVREVALRFGVEVSLAPSVDGTTRVTAFYPLLTGIDSVLADLATQQNLQVRRTSVGWELF